MTVNLNELDSYPRLLRVKDLQAVLNMGRDSVYRLVHTPGFPKMVMYGIILINPSALKKWLERNYTTIHQGEL